MPAEAAIVHAFRVGRYTVEVSLPAGAADPGVQHVFCDWAPHLPTKPLTVAEQAQLVAGVARAQQLALDVHRGSR